SKHAMEGFTKAMAIELAPHNIRVNSLGPTFLETPMTRPFFENKAFREEVLSKIKLGRLGQLEELTGAIVFLASDASSLMTGAAPPRRPESSAETSAASSTNGPRAVLMSNAPVFILAKTSALNSPRVAGINGAWMETKSAISSNRSKLTPSTPAAASACCDT